MSVERYKDGLLMEVAYPRGLLGFLLRRPPKIVTYFTENGILWYRFPSGKRVDPFKEAELDELFEAHRLRSKFAEVGS